jgi:hypothetical protein
VAIVAAGPVGNLINLGCGILLGSICGVAPYPGRAGDRWIGRAFLLLGVLLVGWAIGAGRRSAASSRAARILFSVRWAFLPAVVVATLVVSLAYNPGRPTEVVVTIANSRAGLETRTYARQDMKPTRPSWYRQSWDHMLGLPAAGFDPADLSSSQPGSRFVIAGPLPSLEGWKRELTEVIVSNHVRGSGSGGTIQIGLVSRRSATAPIEYRLRVKEAHPCPNPSLTEGFCYWTDDVGYREGARTVNLTVDFAGLE